MSQTSEPQGNVQETKPRKSMAVKIVPFAIIALVIAFAAYAASRPSPGQRTTTDTSVKLIISTASPAATVDYPITLQEGGDPAHESDHVFEPLQALDGVANATLDWSSGVVLTVQYDPERTSEQEIAGALAESGYLRGPTGGSQEETPTE